MICYAVRESTCTVDLSGVQTLQPGFGKRSGVVDSLQSISTGKDDSNNPSVVLLLQFSTALISIRPVKRKTVYTPLNLTIKRLLRCIVTKKLTEGGG